MGKKVQGPRNGRTSAAVKVASILLPIIAALTLAPSVEAVEEPSSSATESTVDAASALECLALNIYHEARGESEEGKRAVGHVVLNRSLDGRFPRELCDVVRQGGDKHLHRCQFSWWCDGLSDRPREAQAWQEALRIAHLIMAGESADPTGGALWYHADYVQPYWQQAFERGPSIGHHVFYRRSPAPLVADASPHRVASASVSVK
ncbi:MAG: cell wall hydrolase [Alphaproteobacteria bacterium]|nr:cell wall hydrolase [Alphaproteobacteria bacterium]